MHPVIVCIAKKENDYIEEFIKSPVANYKTLASIYKIFEVTTSEEQYEPTDIVSATQVTSSSNLKERVYFYHTMWNRQIRKIDLKLIDFSKIKEQIIDDDSSKENSVKDVTPQANIQKKG